MRYTVTHRGVPVGTVDLEIGTTQALGSLEPAPAYEAIRPIIQDASRLGAEARTELFVLPADAEPRSRGLNPAASLVFGLEDEHGAQVAVDVVRLVELQVRPGVTVFVEFKHAASDVLAPRRPAPRTDGAERRPEA